MDTGVLYAALRSRKGWSFALLKALMLDRWQAVVSNHLFHEYEELIKRNAEELRLSLADVDALLDAIAARAEERTLAAEWRPILTDPDDEPLVQLASESGAKCIVTHNVRHLAPARSLGIAVLLPREFAAIIGLR